MKNKVFEDEIVSDIERMVEEIVKIVPDTKHRSAGWIKQIRSGLIKSESLKAWLKGLSLHYQEQRGRRAFSAYLGSLSA